MVVKIDAEREQAFLRGRDGRAVVETTGTLTSARAFVQAVRGKWVRGGLAVVIWLLIAFFLPVVIPGSTYFAGGVTIFVLFTTWTSFLVGYSGIPAFGNQLFYGAGGYCTGWLVATQGVDNAFVSLGASLVVGGILAAVFGVLTRGRVGLVFGMLTLAVGEAAYVFLTQSSYLYGEGGVSGIFPGSVFGASLLSSDNLFRFVFFFSTVGFLALVAVRKSFFGLLVGAIRQDRARSSALGIHNDRYQMLAFALAGAFCGLAGSLEAIYVGSAGPSTFDWIVGATPVLAGLIGGIRSVWGPVVGAVLYEVLANYLPQMTNGWELWFGALVVVLFMVSPEGLGGMMRRRASGPIE